MDDSPYSLSALHTTDAHAGGGAAGNSHTCRRLSWHSTHHRRSVDNLDAPSTSGQLHSIPLLAAGSNINNHQPPLNNHTYQVTTPLTYHLACDSQALIQGSSPPHQLSLQHCPTTTATEPTSSLLLATSGSTSNSALDDIVDADDVPAESVDLLRMLPDSQRIGPLSKEINPRRTRCAYLQRDDDDAEDSGGAYDDGVLFYNSLRCASEYSNREQEERIAFLSRSYSALDKTKPRNNNGSGIYSDMEQSSSAAAAAANSTRSPNIAEYCTSKAHSRSCGSLTYPPPQRNTTTTQNNDKNRSTRNVYADSSGLKHKRLKRVKRCVFLGAIFLGIVLATTGIIVAFLVYAPFHMKAHNCRNGYIFCGKTGCVTPRRLCGSKLKCPGIKQEQLCHGNRSDHAKDFIYSEGLPVTLNPLLREGTLLFGKDVSGWVYFQGGSNNGSRYITVHRAMTFYGAQESCRDQGGHLAHVNTVREQVFLEDYLNQIYKRHKFPADMLGFWVGARRARGSHAGSCLYNQWQWMDTYGRAHGTVTGFTAFASGKPDNFFAPEECLYLSTTHSHDESRYLKWDDAPCDIHGIGTIYAACEVELR